MNRVISDHTTHNTLYAYKMSHIHQPKAIDSHIQTHETKKPHCYEIKCSHRHIHIHRTFLFNYKEFIMHERATWNDIYMKMKTKMRKKEEEERPLTKEKKSDEILLIKNERIQFVVI